MFVINKKTQEISEKHNKESTQHHTEITTVRFPDFSKKIQIMYKITGR